MAIHYKKEIISPEVLQELYPLSAKQKEQRAASFFADILGDFRSNNLTNEEVYFLHEELRALLGWDF